MSVSFMKWQESLETGVKYLAEGDSEKAEEYFQLSLSEAEVLEVSIIIAFSVRLLATAQLRNNKLNEAERGFSRALDHCLKLDNKKGIAEAKAGMASIFFVRGEYSKSVYLYKEAINIYPVNSSPLRLAVLFSDLGQVYCRMKKWEKAEDIFLKAKALCQQNGYRQGEAEVNQSLGEVYYCQGMNDAARIMFKSAASIFGSVGDEISLANAQQYLAFLYLEGNKIEEALLYQYRVICLYLKHDLSKEISESYYLLSNILQYCRLYEEAQHSINVSLKYYNGFEFGFAVRFHSLASIALMKKDYEDAKKFYFEALKFFQFHGDGLKVGEICEELTFLLRYEEACLRGNLYKWLGGRYFSNYFTKYEVMLQLANSLNTKGNNLAALRCSWRALEIAKAMKYETEEIEVLIQNISEKLRKKNK